MSDWRIMDNNGTIYSGYSEEETEEIYKSIQNGKTVLDWDGDLLLVEVHEIFKWGENANPYRFVRFFG